MMRVLLDTNVLASGLAGLHRPDSTPGELLRRWRAQQLTLVVSDHLLAELARTLTAPYFAARIRPAQTQTLLSALRQQTELTPITHPVTGVATHPEDDLILAAARSAQVPYLVTGDRDLLALGQVATTTILTPRAALTLLVERLTPPPDDAA
jgi:putative PIN family toxin of toxin-antitoxin system